jgi:YidC/Oxa1 family membrane protein insertase
MDNQRLILALALFFVLFLIWQAWQQDYGPTPPPTTSTEAPQTDVRRATDVPTPPSAEPTAATPPGPAPQAAPRGQRVQVRTDLLAVEIDTLGGDVRKVDLLTYPVSADQPDEPFRLLDDSPGRFFIAQSGLISRDASAPDHHARYRAERTSYELPAGGDNLSVRLTWSGPDGLSVDKVYTFRRNSFQIELTHEVHNATGTPWTGRQYRQLQRVKTERESRFVYTYTGGVIYSPEEKYEKISFDDMAKSDLSRDVTGGWVAMIQHYFLGAWLPETDSPEHFYSKSLQGERFALGMVAPPTTIAPGESHRFTTRLFAGPKRHQRLAEAAPGLERTVDYGYLTVISEPLFIALKWIHKVVGNWGWSIIILTILIKLAFYKLSETSYRSMANMRKLAPRLQSLKERYGDDRQRMQQAMMEIYKKEKINPLGGCLPILVQIPVFIALYWVLLESVELRQAPFILWIDDLSTKDPYYVLPVLMGSSMFLQQRLNPPMMDPIQQRVMMLLPLVFTVFFAFFPAGLVLYWTVNNVLSITQQWYITRRIEKGAK